MAAALRLAVQMAGENYIKSVTYTDSAGTPPAERLFCRGATLTRHTPQSLRATIAALAYPKPFP